MLYSDTVALKRIKQQKIIVSSLKCFPMTFLEVMGFCHGNLKVISIDTNADKISKKSFQVEIKSIGRTLSFSMLFQKPYKQ